jgi:ribosomal protein L16 Arg81 hydroxylase
MALLRAGLTVYFQDLGRVASQSGPWLRSLEASLGLPQCASLMAFANARGTGLPLHHDRHDQLLFQIRGNKSFRHAPNGFVKSPDIQFSPGAAAHPDFGSRYQQGFPASSQELLQRPFETIKLSPGSAFFLPAGTWHATAGQDEESLSLVVALRAPSRLTLLLNALTYYAGQSPEWRERTYGAWDAEPQVAERSRQQWASLLGDLARRLSDLPVAALHDAWTAHLFTTGEQSDYPLQARFERFIRLPNSSLQMELDAELGKLRCVVSSGPSHRPQARTVIGVNPEARVVLDWILATRAAFTLAALGEAFPGFERDELEDLLGWLASAALIRPLPVPIWAD